MQALRTLNLLLRCAARTELEALLDHDILLENSWSKTDSKRKMKFKKILNTCLVQ